MIRVVCCYCKKPVKTLPSESDEVSHGVCDRCLPLMVRELGQPMQEFLDELSAPVLVVQDNARVISANAAARKLLSREQLEICGELAGDVIGCRHAREPGGCGRTVFQSGATAPAGRIAPPSRIVRDPRRIGRHPPERAGRRWRRRSPTPIPDRANRGCGPPQPGSMRPV